jgi:hypothetical protein
VSRRSVSQSLFGRQNPAVLLLGPLLLFVSCEDKFMKQTTADKTAAIATLQTKLDDSGNHVASFDPTKSETQLMRITSGAIAGAAVAIPPAALSIPVSIAVGEGVSLATSSFSQTLGITDNKINAGGPSVSFSASQDVVASNPMTLSIPFGSTSLSLNDGESENIIVMYRWTTIENGETKFEAGILPGENVTRAKNKVSFQTTKFGTFQVGVAEKKITTAVVAKTEEPPALKSCEMYAAELYPKCSTHNQTTCLTSDSYRAADANMLKQEFFLSDISIGNVTLPTASKVIVGTSYGAMGNIKGTFSLNANDMSLRSCDRFIAAVYPNCSKDGQIGCVTTAAYPAADMTLIKSDFILAGRVIAGVSGSVVLPDASKVLSGTQYGVGGVGTTGTYVADRPILIYATPSSIDGKIGDPLSISPSTLDPKGSNITKCQVQPNTTALPSWAIINQTSCVISGTPNALQNTTNYSIGATNAIGDSLDATVTIGVLATTEAPTFYPPAGTYGPTLSVTLSSSTNGATIYYTTDETTPSTTSTQYTAAISVPVTKTIKAIANGSNLFNSQVVTATYIIDATPPAITSASVTTSSPGITRTPNVTFTSNESGTYQLFSESDCSTGSISNIGNLLASTNTAATTTLLDNIKTTIYVKATDAFANISCTLIGSYTHDDTRPLKPVISDTNKSFNASFTTLIQQNSPTDTNFKEFRYTTTSTTISCSAGTQSAAEPTSVTIPAAHTTLKAIACDKAGNASDIASVTYTYDNVPPNPPVVTGPSTSPSTKPTWTWTSGGNGNGTYRYKLDDNDLSSGAIQSTANAFTPTEDLTETDHTLYVQERDDAGNWSNDGSYKITIQTPPATPNISATSAVESVIVSWSQDTGVTYTLYWATTSGVTIGSSAIINVSSPFTHRNITAATPYYYRLVATKGGLSSGLSSALSNEVTGTPIPALQLSPAYAVINPDITPSFSFSASGGSGTISYSASSGGTTKTLTNGIYNVADFGGFGVASIQASDSGVPINQTAEAKLVQVATKFNGPVNAMLIHNGFGYFAGDFDAYNPNLMTALGKLNYYNGDLESQCNFAGLINAGAVVNALAETPRHLYIGGIISRYAETPVSNLIKVDKITCHLDQTFSSGEGFSGEINALALQGSSLYVGGAFSTYRGSSVGKIAKINIITGDLETFVNGVGFDNQVNTLSLSDTDLYVGGRFTTYAGASTPRLAKLALASGVRDTSFSIGSGPSHEVYSVVYSNSSLYIGGIFTSYNGLATAKYFAKINPDGSLDSSFTRSNGFNAAVRAIAPTTAGIYVGGDFSSYSGTPRSRIAKLLMVGDIDSSFGTDAGFAGGSVHTLALSDGSLYVGGAFLTYNGNYSQRLAKLSASNGSLDTNFTKKTGLNGMVRTILATGSFVYVGGHFTHYRGTRVPRIAKINLADKTVDSAFNQGIGGGFDNSVSSLAVDYSALYVGGRFTAFNAQTANRIAKLDLASGNLVTGFTTGSGFDGDVRTILLQESSGRLYVGGDFSTYNNTSTPRLVCLNKDTGDKSALFNSSTNGFTINDSTTVNTILESGGSLFIGGSFSKYRGTIYNSLVKVDPTTGAPATGFNSNSGFQQNTSPGMVSSMVTDGTHLYVGGNFLKYSGSTAQNFAKIRLSDFTLDTTFTQSTGCNNSVSVLAIQGSSLYVGGYFTTYRSTTTQGLAKLDLLTGQLDTNFTQSNGFNNAVTMLFASGSSLMVSGPFTSYRGSVLANTTPFFTILDANSGDSTGVFPSTWAQ